MTIAAWELQKAVHAALIGSASLTALLGGTRIYDRVPRGAAFPYVTFGPATSRDWSTGTEEGSEHILTLNAWSKAGGLREVHLILDAIAEALEAAIPAPAGQHVVNLRREISEATRERDGETWRGAIRFRVALEPVT